MEAFYSYLIPGLWIAWILYWKLAARNVKQTTRRESFGSLLSHSIFLVAAIALISWPDSTGNVLFQSVWPRSAFTFWGGTALVAAGLGFTIWARLALGRNWSGTVTLKENHELVQTGPFRWVRHPIYTGLLVAFAGSALAISEWRGILACVLALIAFRIRIRIEERWMTELFGPVYHEYKQRVRMLIPFVW